MGIPDFIGKKTNPEAMFLASRFAWVFTRRILAHNRITTITRA